MTIRDPEQRERAIVALERLATGALRTAAALERIAATQEKPETRDV